MRLDVQVVEERDDERLGRGALFLQVRPEQRHASASA
jgi:hypothetical protein